MYRKAIIGQVRTPLLVPGLLSVKDCTDRLRRGNGGTPRDGEELDQRPHSHKAREVLGHMKGGQCNRRDWKRSLCGIS